ncbi:hypothetical protein [Clostridium sp. HBUAS56017]|uniref:rolling circle replication-associated protein n=1 Tax=Clostridium sp. HBUAS56017 TaxID=2571128 RepID=UPI0011774FBF|nr:hypothetical protein [Clostridium sp. HBUAS56017]
MPYIESICKAGKTIEIERYYTSIFKKKGIKRADKVKPTREEQKKINYKQAEKKLRWKINENFQGGDFHLVLGYEKDKRPGTKEEMRKDANKFLRSLRNEFKKQGKELKYIHVMEIGSKGAMHHHLVINKIDLEIIRKCWTKGRPQIFPLDDSGQYRDLASYLIKQTSTTKEMQNKRWNCSKNLVMPEPEKKEISYREYFRVEAKAKKGYYVDKDTVETGVHNPEYSGYGFFRYTLIKIQTSNKRLN